jgi:predicted secreted protein
MAIKTFKVGKLSIDTTDVGEVNNMSLSITLDTGETTEINDDWKTYLALGKSWTLSGSLYYDPDDTVQAALRTEFISGDGDLSDIDMYEDDTHYFSGDGIITSFAVTKAINANDTLAITIIGNGELDYS